MHREGYYKCYCIHENTTLQNVNTLCKPIQALLQNNDSQSACQYLAVGTQYHLNYFSTITQVNTAVNTSKTTE